MFPFKKKVEVEEPVEKLPQKRGRKKKEVIKPWGIRERLVIFVFLILAPALSFLFLSSSKSSSAPKVLGELTSKTRDVGVLKSQLLNETSNLTGTYGVWLQGRDNSYSLGVNENEIFDGASLFKLPLMIEYYKEVEKGNIDPQTTYTLKYSDLQSGAGILATQPPGTILTYQEITDSLGKNSDNTGFSILGNILGWDKEYSIINDLGMVNTNFDESTTTPKDIGTLFYKLLNTNILSQKSKDEMLNSLVGTDYENYLPAGIPKNIRIAHKYAADSGELNDAGVIYSNEPFILVVLAKDINYDEAQKEFPKISQIVYDWAKK